MGGNLFHGNVPLVVENAAGGLPFAHHVDCVTIEGDFRGERTSMKDGR